jgi:PII-like signaling protein
VTAATESIPKEPLLSMCGKRMLRIDIRDDGEWNGRPLYEAIIRRADKFGVAGGTVYRGILGYRKHHHIARREPFDLWRDDPVTVVIVDEAEKLIALIAALTPLLTGGCTISDVTLVTYSERPDDNEHLVREEPQP